MKDQGDSSPRMICFTTFLPNDLGKPANTHSSHKKEEFFLCPSESKPHFGGISPHPFLTMTVVKSHPTFHCAFIYCRIINITRWLLKGNFAPPKEELIRESLVLEATFTLDYEQLSSSKAQWRISEIHYSDSFLK